jgi:hypothetical protein
MMPTDFPCFVCGSEGPHRRIPRQRDPTMSDAAWAPFATAPPLIYCNACHQTIWEPDTGDGLADPNLTMIRPALRDLAHQALEERDAVQFLILAEGHHRHVLMEDNALLLRRLEMWDDVLLAQLRLISRE